jgi:hypothetical protein
VSEEKNVSDSAPHAAGEACARLLDDLSAVLRTLTPNEDARRHFRSARIEMLKGLRSVIDHRIEQLSQEPPKGTSVSVE